MKTIAIVPCKSLSERLPRKNTMRVGGQTLVERAVYVANACDAVVLCSDDEAIIAQGVAMAERVRVRAIPFLLTDELAGKRVQLEDVIETVIARHPADRYVLLQPTSPLRKRRHVASALAMLGEFDSVLSVHEVTKEVYFSGTVSKAGEWTAGRPKGVRMFTNDLPKLVAENGAVYAWTHDTWLKTRDRSGGRCGAMEMSPEDSVDIDTPAELERAQKAWNWDATERHEP
jgi:CMP-N-acetylneuraminic acid synthetase